MRAFESAARHQSISLAASELNVTPAAISQQIKLLEQVLDLQLFIRQNRQIELTEEGQLLKPLLTEAFEQMHRALQTLRTHQQGQPLTITAPQSFVAKWLIPRLEDFNQQHPEISVRIDASIRLVDFEHEAIDVGIRFGLQPDPDLVSTHLTTLQVIPTCSPEFLKKHKQLKTPADINNQTLLHYDSQGNYPTWPDWNMWLATIGYPEINTKPGIYFAQSDMVIQAAIEGQGIALVPSILAEKDIQAGRLVQPFSIATPIDFSYYLVTTPNRSRLPRVIAFKQWILQQIAMYT